MEIAARTLKQLINVSHVFKKFEYDGERNGKYGKKKPKSNVCR